ncbi:uncharacterized protein LOC128260230 isoform X2 [Drosophila gunungcola]|uniref:uncharacterized protein LOC128260230 isoform X2 n=1 Tax=Drosophila gunungcola TaxID=103775 RepID=UPI0022E331FD|nr:uncharacterized protein LOC128260230 isoform X2 [Drosophila gunungcola]
MELKREMPTDDASMELDGAEPWNMVRSSDSLLTLKRSWSQETVIPSADDMHVPSELSSDDFHLGLLVEKGLIEYDSLDQIFDEDEAGDYPRLLSRSADRGGIAEIVKEMRNEFMVKMSSKAKSLKEVLIKGMMEHKEDGPVEREPKSELEDESKTADESKVSSNDETGEAPCREVLRSDGITQLINEINQFTSSMDRNPDSADWGQFRANLLKIHKYYGSIGEPEKNNPVGTADIHSAVQATIISDPLNDLQNRAKSLRRNIKGLECKMLTLDNSFEDFCDTFNRSLISKERVERDMVVLAMMRDGIGRRLSQMELEFRRAKDHLFSRRRNSETQSQSQIVLHAHNTPDCGA